MRAKWLMGAAFMMAGLGAAAQAAEPDGLVLPQGFHAEVVADGIKGLRHMAITPDGVIYATTRSDGIAALKLDQEHKAGVPQFFAKEVGSGTGIRIYHGALYASSVAAVYRIKLDRNLIPSAQPEKILDGMPTGGFNNRVLAIDNASNLYVGVGGSGNTCTGTTPKGVKPVGLTPCPGVEGRGGIWKFKAGKLNQKFPDDGIQVATGLRDLDALDFRRGDALYGIMQNRNATHAQFPDVVSADEDDAIAEEMFRFPAKKVTNMGWPYTYWDGKQQIRLMAPEYGGNDKTQPPAGMYAVPVAGFYPSHSPLDLLFYNARQYPAHYRGGAFVVQHGGNGGHDISGHAGYEVDFIPFDHGNAGTPEVFADGFAGVGQAAKLPQIATYRPVGGAVGPDGSLYVGDSQKGRIWRIAYEH